MSEAPSENESSANVVALKKTTALLVGSSVFTYLVVLAVSHVLSYLGVEVWVRHAVELAVGLVSFFWVAAWVHRSGTTHEDGTH